MFRAGGEPRGVPAFTSPVVLLADISEWQPDIADAAYLAWSQAIVIRAMYGDAHDDNAWHAGARRDALHTGGAKFIGIYQYLVAGQDAAAQAHALTALLGHLRPGEKLICDLEEGDGDQGARFRQWSAVLTAAYGRAADPWCYSGLDFAATHGVSPQWVAAYQPSEPATPHLMWQFTDSFPVPGVGLADCSRFHGTIGELAAYGWQGSTPPRKEDSDMQVSPIPLPAWQSGPGQSNPAITIDLSAAGTFKAIGFTSDWTKAGEVQPRIRVAVHSYSKGFSQVVEEAVPGTGKWVLTFDAADVDYVSVCRANASPAFVTVGT